MVYYTDEQIKEAAEHGSPIVKYVYNMYFGCHPKGCKSCVFFKNENCTALDTCFSSAQLIKLKQTHPEYFI